MRVILSVTLGYGFLVWQMCASHALNSRVVVNGGVLIAV
jgi:hypothetical protein